MANQYVNKVVQSNGTTLIDISDTTAVASDVAQGKYFYLASGERVAGTASGGGGTLVSKNITLNGTYDPEDDNADGYDEVTVNVQNGATMTEVQNQYGTELVISSAEGAGPSATRHTLYFEYEDETTETIYVYYDDALIGSAITAITPTTRDNKTVTSAQLDGVEWYSYTPAPVGPTYDTIFDDDITVASGGITITALSNLYFASGETWRVTWAGTEYICQTAEYQGWIWTIGNQGLATGTGGTGEPFCLYNYGGGAMNGNAQEEGTVHLKLERQVSS